MSVNSKMTAIANATRALDGSTAALTLDGIASKLGVEKTNVTAALAAIAEKGVTVPSGSTSDALAELIASIEAGGSEIEEGTFQLSKLTSSHTVTFSKTHATTPDIAVLFKTPETNDTNNYLVQVIVYYGTKGGTTYAGYTYGYINSNQCFPTLNKSFARVGVASTSSVTFEPVGISGQLTSAAPYTWFAIWR